MEYGLIEIVKEIEHMTRSFQREWKKWIAKEWNTMDISEMRRDRLREILRSGGIFLILFCLTFLWYGKTEYNVMMGDDLLYLYSELEGKSFFEAVFNINQVMGKYRPVLFAVMYIPSRLFGIHYELYYYSNLVLLTIASSIVFFFLYKYTERRVLSFVPSIMFIISPFSAYNVGQVFGAMESLAIIFMVCVLDQTFNYTMNKGRKSLVLLVLFWGMALFTTERMMWMFPCIILVIMFTKSKVICKLEAISLVVLPLILKGIISNLSNVSMLETGRGSVFELISTVIPLALKGVTNVFGFALGDAWHGGFDLLSLPQGVCEISLLNLVLFIIFMYIGVISIYLQWHKNVILEKLDSDSECDCVLCTKIKGLIIVFSFCVTSIASYALVAKTHGEDRFLNQTYLLLLVFIVLISAQIPRSYKVTIILVTMCICRMLTDYIYAKNKDGVHWKYSLKEAQTIYNAVKEKNPHGIDGRNVFVMYATNDFPWIMGDQFFINYYFDQDSQTFYIDTIDDLPIEYRNDEKSIFLVPSKSEAYTVECITYLQLQEYGKDG